MKEIEHVNDWLKEAKEDSKDTSFLSVILSREPNFADAVLALMEQEAKIMEDQEAAGVYGG
jgi:hypothetical protein